MNGLESGVLLGKRTGEIRKNDRSFWENRDIRRKISPVFIQEWRKRGGKSGKFLRNEDSRKKEESGVKRMEYSGLNGKSGILKSARALFL